MSQTISYGGRVESVAQAKGGAARPQGVRLRTVALPVEHGGWGLALEPLALGLILAPSLPGAFLALATVGAFLARHPLKIVMGDRRRGRRFARTPVAARFALLYGGAALLSFTVALLTGPYLMLLPLALAAPLAILQLVYDSAGHSRALVPELAGSVAMAALVSSLALAGGWALAPALALWALLASRVVPAIIYVRARLRFNRGEKLFRFPVILLHLAAILTVLALARAGLAPWLGFAALVALLLRAALGLYAGSRQVKARQVGIREIVFGAMTILLVAMGHYLGV